MNHAVWSHPAISQKKSSFYLDTATFLQYSTIRNKKEEGKFDVFEI